MSRKISSTLTVYDPQMQAFVKDGECGRAVLTTLLPVGGKSGMLLINYDTEDTTVVLSRDRCACGRTHMRIANPEREAETVWVQNNPFNRVDIEAAVFQNESMDYLTGEYESFVTSQKGMSPDPGTATLTVRLECFDPDRCDRPLVEDRFIKRFFRYKPGLRDGSIREILNWRLNICLRAALHSSGRRDARKGLSTGARCNVNEIRKKMERTGCNGP